MHLRDRSPMPRRGFLSGLGFLPLIGGAVAIVGKPSAATTPVSDALLWSYKAWLHAEHRMLSFEIAGHDRQKAREIESRFASWLPPDQDVPGYGWHFQWEGRGPAGWIDAPQPSTRAALVLSAVGCDLTTEAPADGA